VLTGIMSVFLAENCFGNRKTWAEGATEVLVWLEVIFDCFAVVFLP